MPSMDPASVGETPALWMQVGSCLVVLCAALWCWLTKHKHGEHVPTSSLAFHYYLILAQFTAALGLIAIRAALGP